LASASSRDPRVDPVRSPRFFTEQSLAAGQAVTLEEATSHHLLRVLRLKAGESLLLFNGDGREYQAVLQAAAGKRATVLVQDGRQPDRESKLHITLGQGISRGERMDFALQKSVELGVESITPLWTKRSQVQLSGQRLEKRLSHWRGVIRSACEQSGRVYLPTLHSASKLADWYNVGRDQCLQLVLDPAATLQLSDLKPAKQIRILIGPEGGLEGTEISSAEASGFKRIRLGPRILRTETAALATVAAIQALWGDLSGKPVL
jgi:16S rRNA (uracil1498-N3)-methyltransferase